TSGEDQFVASAAGGQQRGGDRSRGIAEEDGDRTAGAVDSIDHGAAFEFDDSITVSAERGADCDLCNEAGVERPHSYGRQVLNGGDKTDFHGEGHDGSEHVSAVRSGLDLCAVRLELGEREIEIDIVGI